MAVSNSVSQEWPFCDRLCKWIQTNIRCCSKVFIPSKSAIFKSIVMFLTVESDSEESNLWTCITFGEVIFFQWFWCQNDRQGRTFRLGGSRRSIFKIVSVYPSSLLKTLASSICKSSQKHASLVWIAYRVQQHVVFCPHSCSADSCGPFDTLMTYVSIFYEI